jgi:S-DNA-T family DNA segregation ATPase FtsK/SpoIIIE
MHLVIGTQRPSVDVITGVIKANIPSRIAFTVASQVDSRTIIDRSGAENLIGRGDMLYNPVGAAKPQRVQGAFVSDSEVDAVVSFIKANNCQNGAEYSDEVMKEIEAQAALCGAKKGSSASGGLPVGDGGDGGDPLIDQALEVAFESGKISTSLLQRRLSVGYGRAAKIIDKMEELGYVSAPEGQKPRQLLITKQDYMEMKLRKEDEE